MTNSSYAEDVGTPARAESAQPGKTPRKMKRFIIFVFLFIVLGAVSAWFRYLSLPAKEDSFLVSAPPQIIRVGTSDPYAKVHLTALVRWKENPPSEALYITVTGPKVRPSTRVVITSSLYAEPQDSAFFSPGMFRDGDRPFRIDDPHIYVCTMSVYELSRLKDPFGFGSFIGTFRLPPITQSSKDTFFAHLPALAHGQSMTYPLPLFISEKLSSGKSNAEDLLWFPNQKSGNVTPVGHKLSDYDLPANSEPHVMYWQPSVSTTEILSDVDDVLADTNIDSNQPSSGHLQDGNFIWESTGSVEAILGATKNDRITSESRWSFYSGIVFGLAAAAGLAIIQELPQEISMTRRRRKR